MTGKKYRVVALILAAVILAAGGVLCYRHFHQTAQPVTAEAGKTMHWGILPITWRIPAV